MTQSKDTAPPSVDPARLRLTGGDNPPGVLLGTRCRDCEIYLFGPATFCQSCTSPNLEPVELSCRGTLFSYTIVRVPPAGWPGPVPYVLGEVELPEGPHVLAEVIDCAESDLKIGLPTELAVQAVESTETGARQTVYMVYKWRLRAETGISTAPPVEEPS